MNTDSAVQASQAAAIQAESGRPAAFLIAILICTFAFSTLFSTSGMAQSLVQFAASKPFQSDEVLLKAKLFRPVGKKGRLPAVILMHGCGGWQPAVAYSLQKHAEYLVKHGFAVLSVDSFGPRHLSGGKLCDSNKQLRDALDYRTHDAFDALRYLQAQSFVDPYNIFLMGQSNGGSVAINAAKADGPGRDNNSMPGFRAVAAYYPWCGSFGGSSKVDLAAPLLVFGGSEDNWVPPKACQNASSSGAELDVKVYPGAVHSFDLQIIRQSYGGKLIGYDKFATEDSRIRMLTFFKKHLAPSPEHTQLVRAR